MASITRDSVLAALSGIGADDGVPDIVARGLVSEILVKDGNVTFAIAAEPGKATEMEAVRLAAEAAIRRLPGAGRVMVALTADRPGAGKAAARGSTAATRGTSLDGVDHIIAEASGKGGVGKSSLAVNLAAAFAAQGQQVGILDADIYGPSMPRLLGITQRPHLVAPDSKIMAPMEKYGLKVMSMGFLVDEATPVVWRGPMVMGALVQMLREVAWAPLDCLVVDMPPGTGDVQLTLAQQTPLAGAVIVSTPQYLALIDARRGV